LGLPQIGVDAVLAAFFSSLIERIVLSAAFDSFYLFEGIQ